MNLKLVTWVRLAVQQAPRILLPPLPSAGVAVTLGHALLSCGAGDLNSGPRGPAASSLTHYTIPLAPPLFIFPFHYSIVKILKGQPGDKELFCESISAHGHSCLSLGHVDLKFPLHYCNK